VGILTRVFDWQLLIDIVAGRPPPRHAGAGLTLGHVHLHVDDLAAARPSASAFWALSR